MMADGQRVLHLVLWTCFLLQAATVGRSDVTRSPKPISAGDSRTDASLLNIQVSKDCDDVTCKDLSSGNKQLSQPSAMPIQRNRRSSTKESNLNFLTQVLPAGSPRDPELANYITGLDRQISQKTFDKHEGYPSHPVLAHISALTRMARDRDPFQDIHSLMHFGKRDTWPDETSILSDQIPGDSGLILDLPLAEEEEAARENSGSEEAPPFDAKEQVENQSRSSQYVDDQTKNSNERYEADYIKRQDRNSAFNALMHFGKRFGEFTPSNSLMHFGKRFGGNGPSHSVMHFGKRYSEGEISSPLDYLVDDSIDHSVNDASFSMHSDKPVHGLGSKYVPATPDAGETEDYDFQEQFPGTLGSVPQSGETWDNDDGDEMNILYPEYDSTNRSAENLDQNDMDSLAGQPSKRFGDNGPYNSVMHFGKRYSGNTPYNSVMHFGKRFDGSSPYNSVMHFGKRFDGSSPYNSVMHFGKRLDGNSPYNSVMHFGKRFDGSSPYNSVMHFGKRFDGSSPYNSVMHFGKRFGENSPYNSVMHFGKRLESSIPYNSVMHFGKRFGGTSPYNSVMHFGKRFDGDSPFNSVMHFGKRFDGSSPYNSVMHFGKRFDGSSPYNSVMHFGKRSDGKSPYNSVMHFGKRFDNNSPYNSVMHFGKRFDGSSPYNSVMHFGKRFDGSSPYNSVMHFGKKLDGNSPYNSVMHFGKRFGGSSPYNSVMHFGKRYDGSSPYNSVMHFGKRLGGNSPYNSLLHFGKRQNSSAQVNLREKRDIQEPNIESTEKKSGLYGPQNSLMHFGKRFNPSGPQNSLMHFGKKFDDTIPFNSVMHFGKRFDSKGPSNSLMHFGKRFDSNGPSNSLMHFGKRFDSKGPSNTLMHFGKRFDSKGPSNSLMHFGKRFDSKGPSNSLMHFGKRFDSKGPSNSLMHFGKRFDSKGPSNSLMHFGKKSQNDIPFNNLMHFGKREDQSRAEDSPSILDKRLPQNSPFNSVLHFGKRSDQRDEDQYPRKNSDGSSPFNTVMHFGKRSDFGGPRNSLMHFGKRFSDNVPFNRVMHFGKRANRPYSSLMNFGKKFDNRGPYNSVMHFGKRSGEEEPDQLKPLLLDISNIGNDNDPQGGPSESFSPNDYLAQSWEDHSNEGSKITNSGSTQNEDDNDAKDPTGSQSLYRKKRMVSGEDKEIFSSGTGTSLTGVEDFSITVSNAATGRGENQQAPAHQSSQRTKNKDFEANGVVEGQGKNSEHTTKTGTDESLKNNIITSNLGEDVPRISPDIHFIGKRSLLPNFPVLRGNVAGDESMGRWYKTSDTVNKLLSELRSREDSGSTWRENPAVRFERNMDSNIGFSNLQNEDPMQILVPISRNINQGNQRFAGSLLQTPKLNFGYYSVYWPRDNHVSFPRLRDPIAKDPREVFPSLGLPYESTILREGVQMNDQYGGCSHPSPLIRKIRSFSPGSDSTKESQERDVSSLPQTSHSSNIIVPNVPTVHLSKQDFPPGNEASNFGHNGNSPEYEYDPNTSDFSFESEAYDVNYEDLSGMNPEGKMTESRLEKRSVIPEQKNEGGSLASTGNEKNSASDRKLFTESHRMVSNIMISPKEQSFITTAKAKHDNRASTNVKASGGNLGNTSPIPKQERSPKSEAPEKDNNKSSNSRMKREIPEMFMEQKRYWGAPFQGAKSVVYPPAWLASQIRKSSLPLELMRSAIPVSHFRLAEKKEVPMNSFLHFG